jgi:hypothetical protein
MILNPPNPIARAGFNIPTEPMLAKEIPNINDNPIIIPERFIDTFL